MSYIKDITKGEWTFFVPIKAPDFAITSCENEIIYAGKNKNDARLIVEAGTVANETGLSPRELLGQRDELLRVLEMAMYEVKDWHEYNFNQIDSFDNNEKDMQIDVASDIWNKLEQIKATIKKITNK